MGAAAPADLLDALDADFCGNIISWSLGGCDSAQWCLHLHDLATEGCVSWSTPSLLLIMGPSAKSPRQMT